MGVKWSGSIGVLERDTAAAGALLNFTRPDLCDPDEEELHGRFIDDIKGCELDPVLTGAARQEGIDEFKSRRVYDVCPKSSMPRGAKIVGSVGSRLIRGLPSVRE